MGTFLPEGQTREIPSGQERPILLARAANQNICCWSGLADICGLSLLLVLSFAPRGFSPGAPVFPSPQKPTFPNSNSTKNQVDEELL